MGALKDNKHIIQTPVGFDISYGLNISHWLSQAYTDISDSSFSELDIIQIKELGFDHIRIPIDEQELWNEDGLIVGRSFLFLKKCLDACIKHSMRAIVVLKKLRNFNANIVENDTVVIWEDLLVQEVYFKMWRNLSDFLKDYPKKMLAYELLNEPNAPTNEDWNSFLQVAINAIRMKEPERVLFLGSNAKQSEETVNTLEIPYGDPNFVISFKYFKPVGLTHFRTNWTPMHKFKGYVQYPGSIISPQAYRETIHEGDEELIHFITENNMLEEWNRDMILSQLKPAYEFAQSLNIPLYCSQFGCIHTVPDDLRKLYFEDLITSFEEYSIAYALWDYKGQFGLISNSAQAQGKPDRHILDAMFTEET